jgi:hypothetical protein
MSVNRRRGEIAAELDGKVRKLCLTLGALAELEAAYAADDLGALVARFSRGSLSALDLARVIAAGLRGAGEDVTEEMVRSMQAEGGVTGFARIVAELLAVTFGGPQEQGSAPNP